MKTENVFALLVAVLAPCLATLGQSGPLTPSAPVVAPLTGPDSAVTNTPAGDEIVDLVNLDAVSLPDAIRMLALQAGLNIQFDPKLINAVGPDGRPVPPPTVTEKWHKVTAMQAMEALLANWGWQLQWDPRTKIGRVTARDPAALEPLVVVVIPLRYSEPTNIITEVASTLSVRSTIIPDRRTRQLVIRTTEKEVAGVEALVEKLDTATRQVLIEAKVVETTKDITSAKGVDWTGTLAAQHVSFGNGITSGTVTSGTTANSGTGTGGTTTLPGGTTTALPGGGSSGISSVVSNLTSLTTAVPGNPASGGGLSLNTAHGFSPATAFLSADGLQAVLSFLNTDADTKSISFPRTVTLDGVQTELMVVQNVPVFEQTQSAPAGGSASGLATIQPNYDLKVNGAILNEVGVKLTVTPRCAGPTNILLDLRPEVSQKDALVATETLAGQVNTAPIFDRRTIITSASVPSGFTLVIGGLDSDVITKTYTKVPLLGDLPGLGYAFRSDSLSHTKDIILIFVTPTIIQDLDFQPGQSTFLSRKQSAPSNIKESSWDTGEPYDWTKPKQNVKPDYQP
jgi:type II secretory pathway component GspD/PulD (secretin)